MKKQFPTTSLLGLTHQQLATLLNVSRPLITLYESGQRDLPLHAKQLLTELLLNTKHPKTEKSKTKSKEENEVLLIELKRILRENHYQQLLTAKRITALQKKQLANTRLAQLAKYLSAKNNKLEKSVTQPILNKANKTSKQDFNVLLLNLELKQKTLQFEKNLVEDKINQLTKKPIK